MSSSSLQAYLEIVNSCIAQGGKFLALQGRYFVSPLPDGAVYERWKTPAGKWRDIDSNPGALARLGKGGWVGLQPDTLGLVVLDLDEGDIGLFELALDALDVGYVVVPSGKAGRAHFYLRAGADWPKGNWNWSHGDQGGQVRFDNGYVICWDIEALPDALELSAGADLALAEHLGYKRAPAQASLLADPELPGRLRAAARSAPDVDISPERYPAGARDDVLLTDLNRLAHDGLIDNAEVVDRYRRAWLDAPQPKPHEDRLAIFEDKLQRARAHVAEVQAALMADGIFRHKSALVQHDALTKLGIAWAHNLRTGDFMYRNGASVLVSEKAGAVEGQLREKLADGFKYESAAGRKLRLKFTVTEFEDNMTALVGLKPEKSTDDFLLWLERDLPAWDGAVRVEGLLIALFGAEDNSLARWAARFLFLGPIQRAYQPGCKLDETPVLIGKQGIGKSALLGNLFPAEKRGAWFADNLDMTAPAKEKMETTRGAVLVEIAEMAGVGREWQKQKAYLTATHDRARMAYDRKTSNYPRRYTFAGSADRPEALPNDPAGLRRFVSVQLQHGSDIEAHMSEWRLQLWAEALTMYRLAAGAGEVRIANLPRDLAAAQAEANEQFRYRDDQLEDAVAELDGNDLSFAEIAQAVGLPGNMNKNQRRRLTDALAHHGWANVRTRAGGKQRRVWRRAQSAELL